MVEQAPGLVECHPTHFSHRRVEKMSVNEFDHPALHKTALVGA